MTDKPDDNQQEKKIIVDEDWKTQVEAEKETLKSQEQKEEKEAAQTEAAAGTKVPLPPASLEFLMTSLATQAMVALGLVPDPVSGKAEPQLDQAKHFIDTLAMLEEKTEGNRTPTETAVLENLLHEFRLGYIAVQQQGGGQ